ncbi:hypothetical protein B9R42_05170 [Arthrospira platensis PCC 7345]|jgi:putative transposase|uniref:Transposase n=1 Tax=Limnospira platensis NIES-46 TaxID=1236695 RepID=A0A5M3TB33_LIMPL|nr:transposase [Arthrospira platensis NIES-46]
MLVLEFKVKGKSHQYAAIDEAIRTAQFVRNKALRYWMDNRGVNKYDLNKYCRVLAREYDWARELNSTARQASMVAYEDLRIKNIVRNHCLAKSIHDALWYQFRKWLEYFGVKFGKITVAVNPAYTSQKCSSCGTVVKKSLSTRTHVCQCGCELDRDYNAAINILKAALSTVGHTET